MHDKFPQHEIEQLKFVSICVCDLTKRFVMHDCNTSTILLHRIAFYS
ncbi:unnamed protein product [Amoebophrya sp. A120]|nr:unnamed protein product [Amoebophrya sp. A120]CAD7973930.1 unnamed protein product [Amoebophrya sp. A120]|eukprot:GSA120T00023853001.1